MPSDRDLAQQWLAEQLHSIRCGCGSMDGASREDAAAILDTPGVEVHRSLLLGRPMILLPIDDKEERDVQR